MKEWKLITNYPTYKISSNGEIFSIKSNKILKPFKLGNYLTVTLCKNGKSKNFSIHRLVAEAFIPNPNNYPQVNHKDEVTVNNNVNNLEWCTAKYNANYGKRLDWCKKAIICLETGKTYQSISDCGREFNVSMSNILACCDNKYKQLSCKGYHFCYIDNIKTIDDIEKTRGIPHATKIKCVELNKEFNSISTAARYLNIKSYGISACISGKQKTSAGYHWIKL